MVIKGAFVEKVLKKKLPEGKFEDVPLKRSKTMSAIKSKGNKTTEITFRMALVRASIRGWKLHPKGLPGNPDFIFPARKTVVFLDGCFWHGCPKCGHIPKTNIGYWRTKIQMNKNAK